MININIEEEILKIFQKLEDENWVSESEPAERRYEKTKRHRGVV